MQRGFLGPIGDDLPALIPLLFALVVFFSVFTFAFTSFDQKTQLFQMHLTAINIGRTIKGASYISGYCNPKLEGTGCDALSFATKCNQLKRDITQVRFMAGLIELPLNKDEEPDIITNFFASSPGSPGYLPADRPFYDDPEDVIPAGVEGPGEFICSSIPLDDELADKNPFGLRGVDVVSYIFPVALETEHAVKPMRLVVIVWR